MGFRFWKLFVGLTLCLTAINALSNTALSGVSVSDSAIISGKVELTAPPITCYRDLDGDGYGDATQSLVFPDAPCASVLGVSYVSNSTDCNDSPTTGVNVNPGATEVCDGADNDCDWSSLT